MGTRDTPVYHLFMDAAYEVGKKVVLITPARFLFNAGFTPKAWNEKMLADAHLTVAHYESDSNSLFPSLTDPIKGGIAVTYRDAERELGPIGFFAKHPELNTILHKVRESGTAYLDGDVSSARSYATRRRCTRTTPRRRPRCRVKRRLASARTRSSSSRSSSTRPGQTTTTSTCRSSA